MSASSPARGKRREASSDDEEPARRTPGGLAVELEHMRWRHLGWAAGGVVVGVILILKLGAVGQGLGVVLIGIGLLAAYAFARTLLFPAGTIRVGDETVELPRGLCKGEPARFKVEEIKHAYLLRRAVPWTRAAPVLVVEAGERAYSYPRDWFLTEADQRRIVRELHARGVGEPAAS